MDEREYDEEQQEDFVEEEDVWEDPNEEVDEMEDGPRTIIVGGCSQIETVDDALERYRGGGDRIIILPGVYETGMILDAGRFPRLHICGAFPAPTPEEERAERERQRYLAANAEEIAEQEAANRWLPPPAFGPEKEPVVIFKGKLSVQFQEATIAQLDEEEGAPLPEGAVPKLTVSNICFMGGASFQEESDIQLNGCTFGIPHLPGRGAAAEGAAVAGADTEAGSGAASGGNADGSGDDAVREPRTVRVSAFATPTFERCKIYGSDRSAVYCYPYARGAFNNCDVVGMVPTPAPEPLLTGAAARRSKAAAAAAAAGPIAATTAPAHCLSDAGIHIDDAQTNFFQCRVRNFNLGVVTNDPCAGSKFIECAVTEIAAVGYLLGDKCATHMRECKARLCGREAAVVGPRSHVSMRGSCFAGDVRLTESAILTALVDNYVGPQKSNFSVQNEARQFSDRGFAVVEDDPSARKKRKPPQEEE